MQSVRGVVWTGSELVVTDRLLVRDPGPGEVHVRVEASGICHSDLNVIDGVSPVPAPVVLGHEACGVVERLGPGVDGPAPGTRVVVNAMTPCRRCAACDTGRLSECPRAFAGSGTPFRLDDVPVRSYAAVSSFAELIVVRADQLVPVPDGVRPEVAALVGCAVTTAFGSVRNVAGVDAGDRVAVLGIGGIGVNVVQVCRAQHASQIVAVDVSEPKAAIARRFGATDIVVATPEVDVVQEVRDRSDGGVDVAFECSGSIAAIEAAIEMLRPGGTCVLIGIPPRGARASFAVSHLFASRRIVGAYNGATRAHHDIPLIFELARLGVLELDRLVSCTLPVESVHDAVREMRTGAHIRTVL
ncbi:MAG TPA: zinc-binding dehydrogenase, partial [Acidimicrobiales bacterium]